MRKELSRQPPWWHDLWPCGGWQSWVAPLVIAIFVVSVPPKWAGEHIAGLLLLLALLMARREDWRDGGMRLYATLTLLWLVPVCVAVVAQHIQGLPTATPWSELIKLNLRMLGVGLGVVLLLQRGWLRLSQLTLLALATLSLFALQALVEVWPNMVAMEWRWRSARLYQNSIGNPNPLAHLLVPMVVLAMGLLRRYQSPLLWVALLVGVLGIYWSGTRGALIALLAGIVIMYPPVNWRRVLIYLVFFGAPVYWYLWSGAHLSLGGRSTSVRVDALVFSLDAFMRAPLFGWGFESFMDIPGHRGINAPHNLIADLALSAGVLAVIGWFASSMILGWRLFRARIQATSVLLALFAATIVIGNLEHSLLVSNQFRGMWILVVATACYVVGREGASKSSHPFGPTAGGGPAGSSTADRVGPLHD